MGIQLHPRKNLLLVSNWFENKISVVDIKKIKLNLRLMLVILQLEFFYLKDEKLFVAIKEENYSYSY